MSLKNLITTILIISISVMSGFYYKYYLNPLSIIVHIIIVGIGISFIYYCINILIKYIPRNLSKSLVTILIILSQCFLIALYLAYYIGRESWGLPLTFDLTIVYLKEFENILNVISMTKSTFFIVLISILFLISLPTFASLKNIFESLEKSSVNFLSKRNIIAGLICFLLLPIIFFNIEGKTVKNCKNSDPILSFFLFDYMAQEGSIKYIDDGILVEKENYPNDLIFNKKNVILIICDALRSDHLGVKGYSRNVSPFIDSLASLKNSIAFDNFFSTSSRSFNGISNILSSNYSIRYNNFFIHDLLKKQGYIINFILGGDHTTFYGLRRHYGNNIDNYYDGLTAYRSNSTIGINNDKEVVINKLKGVSEFIGNPTFFYLHLNSTHEVGILEPLFEKYKPSKPAYFNPNIPISMYINDYDNRIIQLDNYLKRIFSIFKTKGYLENSIIIITADHGQALGEKEGVVSHGVSTYLSEISIPLIIIDYGEPIRNLKNKSFFGNQLDIAPTIVDLLDIPAPESWNGYSIFNKRKSKFIFQQERKYYSTIGYMNDSLYQYIYNTSTQKEELFAVYDINMNYNIINNFNKDSLLIFKKELEDFYSLEIE